MKAALPGAADTGQVKQRDRQYNIKNNVNESQFAACVGHGTSANSIDQVQMQRFFDALFKYAEGAVSLRAFAGNKPAHYDLWAKVPASEKDNALQAAFLLAQACANNPEEKAVFCPPVCTFRKGGKADEANLSEGLAISVELDSGDPLEALAVLTALIGKPTMVIKSGGQLTDTETGEVLDKLHIHWRLAYPATTSEDHAKLKEARRLATIIAGGDGSNVPAVHPIRWPGSWHMKGEPRLCEILEANDDAEVHLTDVLSILEAAISESADISPTEPGNVSNHIQHTRKPETHYIELQDKIRSGEQYHDGLVCLSARRAKNGMHEGAIIDELRSLMKASIGPRDERWDERYNDIPRVVRTAMQFAPNINLAVPADMAKLFDSLEVNAPVNGWYVVPFGLDVDPDLSHDSLALDLSKAGFSKDARYVHKWGKWFFWTGTCWKEDDRLLHFTAIRDFLRSKAGELLEWVGKKVDCVSEKEKRALLKWGADNAKTIRQAATVYSVETLARSNSDLVATADQLDANLDFAGTPGGTIDLRCGRLIPAARNHWITKQCTVSPAPEGTPAPLWEAFLQRVFSDDHELIRFMQRTAGYALTGHVGEHKLLFLFGTGSNGKSVFLNTIYKIMGDYSKRAAAQTFLNSPGEQHPTDLAGLHGARLVIGSELPAGKTWNEAVIKDLTGGDIITARFMRQDFFDYMPQFTLFIAGNHRPSFSGIDEAIRRRVCLVPFTQTIPAEERDHELPEKLTAEWPAILRWMIEGAEEWYKVGLCVPEAVSAASADYLEDEDTLSNFFRENLDVDPLGRLPVADMYTRFRKWQCAQGIKQVWTKKAMSTAFAERGIRTRKSGSHFFEGFNLKPEPSEYAGGWG